MCEFYFEHFAYVYIIYLYNYIYLRFYVVENTNFFLVCFNFFVHDSFFILFVRVQIVFFIDTRQCTLRVSFKLVFKFYI